MDLSFIEKMFKNFINESESDMAISKAVKESKKYNVFNLISRVSALNLLQQNQKKSFIFDSFVASLLHESLDSFNSKQIMSDDKFCKIINDISKAHLRFPIDPPENIFVQNVMFYGNYRVLNGIHQTPAYNLQQMIATLFVGKKEYPKSFLDDVYTLVYAMLHISEDIVRSIKDSVTPSEELVVLNGEEFRKLFRYNNDLLNLITFESDECLFLYNDESDQYILLNPSLIPTALLDWIFTIARKYQIFDVVMDDYNQRIFRECKQYLSNLGHKKIRESEIGIELYSCNGYKEYIANVHNNQFMIVLFVYVDSEIIVNRLSYLHSKLEKVGIKKEDVFVTVINNSFESTLIFDTKKLGCFYSPLVVNPFDLMCISINEKSNNTFIPRYLMAKSKLNTNNIGFSSELNAIELYCSNDYSFYLTDETAASEMMTFFAPGDSIDYIARAIHREDKRLAEDTYQNIYTEVVLVDEIRKIYVDLNGMYRQEMSYFLIFENFNLWIKSKNITNVEQFDLCYMLLDILSYWLSESRFVLDKIDGGGRTYELQVVLTNKAEEYQIYDKNITSLNESLEICDAFPVLELWITPAVFQYLRCKDNSREKEFIHKIIHSFNKMVSGQNVNLNIDSLFLNPMRKKSHFLSYDNNPCFKPVKDENYHFVHGADEDMLLDEIGEELIASKSWDIGIINDNKQKQDVMHAVVGILFKKLQDEVSVLHPENLIEVLYDDLEKVLYRNVLIQQRYAQDIACYPEREQKIFEHINTDNKTSVALKFLIEYVASTPPKGESLIGEGEYERLLAICFLIIDWSYKNDLFYYHIFDTPVEILKSHRIGLKHDEFQYMYSVNASIRKNQLISSSTFNDANKPIERKDYLKDIDASFEKEYGYTLNQLVTFVEALNIYSKTKKGDTVFVAKIDEVIKYLETYSTELNKNKIRLIIDSISLKARENYLFPPEPYRKEDVYPWRFNRELSFVRRPILIRDDEMIWGNRQLSHMILFVLDLIDNGKLKTKSKKMESLIGEISDVRGAEFNELVYRKLNSFNAFDVYSNVSKVNRNKIAENKNPLGDIDVLIIDKQYHKIIAGEVKGFNVSRNPYEMYLEYKKMFENTNKKRCFYDKHNRRVDWCNNHVEDFKIQYNLDNVEWEVVGLFILDQPLISTEVYHKDIKMLTEKELSVENIRSVY